MKILSSPSASACCFTRPEPGTIIALTLALTVLPFAMRATSRKSSMRALAQEPMKTRSMRDIDDPLAAPAPYRRARARGRAPAFIGDLGGLRNAAGDRVTCSGLVPQVTSGGSAPARAYLAVEFGVASECNVSQ